MERRWDDSIQKHLTANGCFITLDSDTGFIKWYDFFSTIKSGAFVRNTGNYHQFELIFIRTYIHFNSLNGLLSMSAVFNAESLCLI